MNTVLCVQDLQTHFSTKAGIAKAVDGVSLSVCRGQVLGLVGESGSGKSMTGYSIMRLIDPPGRIVGGKMDLSSSDGNKIDLFALSDEQMRGLRGNRIAMIFQDPMMTLNPVLNIETQMIEAVLAHARVARGEARDRALQALVRVGIPSAAERLSAYPHQFSGGMRQRVCIAIALLNKPDLIIADEPTTALDVTIQGQIIAEMQALCRESGTALIWITHDLSVVAGMADNIAVMYAGRVVETGSVDDVLKYPRHPYTMGLIQSSPAGKTKGCRLHQIPGSAPALTRLPKGCAFSARCDRASAQCLNMAPSLTQNGLHGFSCHHPVQDTTS
jgi:peptide/nickel transport system ATP-binding protein